MSTLKKEDFYNMENQIQKSKGKMIPKDEVLKILADKLKEVDSKNEFIIDRIDGIALKLVINSVLKL